MINDQNIIKLATIIRQAGGKALAVGGYLRDSYLGVPILSKDIDIEVYNIPADRLLALLQNHYEVDLVGQSFGVVKLKYINIDVSLPRRESKFGVSHKDFMTSSDHTMSVTEAASRRDFTINAMAEDPLSGEFFDPFNGFNDLRRHILRHTSDKFSEDALRVLRGMQFIARFDLMVAPETINICRTMDMSWLSAERIYEEWNKLMLKGKEIYKALTFLEEVQWLKFFPELDALRNCRQDPEWHPEGDVWVHTKFCMQYYAATRIAREQWLDSGLLIRVGPAIVERNELLLGYSTLLHDTGKPSTTSVGEDGRIHAYGHESAGENTAAIFMSRMTNQMDFIKQIQLLVGNHMVPDMLYNDKSSDSAIRRLSNRVGRLDLLCELVRCDKGGRPPLLVNDECCKWLLNKAAELQVINQKPKAIVMGRHLIEHLQIPPGKRMGEILERCFEAQLDGAFKDLTTGIEYAKTINV